MEKNCTKLDFCCLLKGLYPDKNQGNVFPAVNLSIFDENRSEKSNFVPDFNLGINQRVILQKNRIFFNVHIQSNTLLINHHFLSSHIHST
jgi:hypothetical protein